MNDIESLEEYFPFAYNLAKRVGQMVKEAFFAKKSIGTKSCPTDLVTKTDRDVEKEIVKAIKATYPSHAFIGEESFAEGKKCVLTEDPTWIVDPIDGTTNFVHQFPYVAVCIGFVNRKKCVFGIVYNPVLDEMFTAKRGYGAYMNGSKLSVSKQNELRESLIMTEFGSSRETKHIGSVFRNMQSVLCAPVHGIHCLGSAALNICMVAKGGAEAYYEFGIHCWDYCAAGIILEEAGGVLTDTNGGPVDLMGRRVIAANNLVIAQSLSKAIVEQVEFCKD